MKYALYLAAAILTLFGLLCLLASKIEPYFMLAFMFCLYGAYKLLAYTNTKYSQQPATW